MITLVELEDGRFKIEIGPIVSENVAHHLAEVLEELSVEGHLVELGGVPGPVLQAVIDAEKEIGEKAGSYEIAVTAGPGGDRTAESKRVRTYRRRRRGATAS